MSIVTLLCKVVPKSKKKGFVADAAADCKCYLHSPPEDGKANKELVQLLAKTLKIRQADVAIVQGATARLKTIALTIEKTKEQVMELLGVAPVVGHLEHQAKLF